MLKLPRYYDSRKLIHGLKNHVSHLCFPQISFRKDNEKWTNFLLMFTYLKQNEHLKYDFILNMSCALFNIPIPSIQLDVRKLLLKFKSTSTCHINTTTKCVLLHQVISLDFDWIHLSQWRTLNGDVVNY